MGYGSSKNNIGNLSYGEIDAVITSPPYEKRLAFGDKDFMVKTSEERSKRIMEGKAGGHYASPEAFKRVAQNLREEYSMNPQNIGNLQGKTYLSEMFKVYCECFKVLKHSGFMVVVVKNFRRNKQEVDLEGDTVRLCQKAGFILWQKIVHVLNSVGFWQINHAKKTPSLLLNMAEYVLVFRKPFGNLYIREQR